MEPISALQALILSAQLAGIDTRLPPPPPVRLAVVREAAAEPKPVLALTLKEIVSEQERAVSWSEVGRGRIGFSVGLDPEASLWVKFRQGARAAAYPPADLENGVEEKFPVERYRFLLENGMVRALPVLPPQYPQANVSLPGMIRSAYELAAHVLFTPVDYAVLYEDGGLVPASVSLVREDSQGALWVTYSKASELSQIKWFLAVNGVLFGMKLEADKLVFYSKPAPPGFMLRAARKRLP